MTTLADGNTYVIWLKDEERTVMRKLFREKGYVRLEAIDSIQYRDYFTHPDNIEIQGRVLCVLRSYDHTFSGLRLGTRPYMQTSGAARTHPTPS